MQENEVIIVDGISPVAYDAIISDAVSYAIISLPFTVNRMGISSETKRALNIAKGRIAEGLFRHFCLQNRIDADFETCTTPYWTVDKRDFLFQGREWDLKNNFIALRGKGMGFRYAHLPALVPNRFSPDKDHPNRADQWHKRLLREFSQSAGVAYLFTFLKEAELEDGDRKNPFLEIRLSEEQVKLIRELYNKFGGKIQQKEPYPEDRFWEAISKRGEEQLFVLNERPPLIITAYATEEHWHLFRNIGPADSGSNYKDYLGNGWYSKNSAGACNFMDHTLRTRITNATVPVSYLPSFLSLVAPVTNRLVFGRIKK
jgi:hypothetical protein